MRNGDFRTDASDGRRIELVGPLRLTHPAGLRGPPYVFLTEIRMVALHFWEKERFLVAALTRNDKNGRSRAMT